MPYRDPFQQNPVIDYNRALKSTVATRNPGLRMSDSASIQSVRPTTATQAPPLPQRPHQSQLTSRPNIAAPAPAPHAQAQVPQDEVSLNWFSNATAQRINTDVLMYKTLYYVSKVHGLQVLDTDAYNVNILAYVNATRDGMVIGSTSSDQSSTPSSGQSKVTANIPTKYDWSLFSSTRGNDPEKLPESMWWTNYFPPARRLDGGKGLIAFDPQLARYVLQWRGHEFEIINVDCRDGTALYSERRQYIRTFDYDAALELIQTVGNWQDVLHDEIWIFDQGYWQKSAALFQSVQKSRWSDIVLPEELKEDLLKTVLRFYDSRESYSKLRVPWKRGLILYGPPGNGKTVSIKATMKTLLDRKDSIPTLYVKSLVSWAGPEASITQIFDKARQQAPCYLVFEDLDSLVGDDVRSFFLNAVDGLSENEGILMVGSTNHLERLDPGIAKRPSRFDRKYLFPDPAARERRRYCQYWQKKLKGNDDVKFPDELLTPIAKLMDGFSFAYMQEAFVSTLLKIANDEQQKDEINELLGEEELWDVVNELEDLEIVSHDKGGDDNDDLDKYVLWREIKIQIANLKKEINRDDD